MAESTELKRSDARRNRDAILAAALDALTASPDASLNAIAKRAGGPNATLYRHFPTREDLVLATYQHEVRETRRCGRLGSSRRNKRRPTPCTTGSSAWRATPSPSTTTGGRPAQGHHAGKRPSPAPTPTARSSQHSTASYKQTSLPASCAPASTPTMSSSRVAGLWQLDPTGDWRGQAQRIYKIVLGGLRPPT